MSSASAEVTRRARAPLDRYDSPAAVGSVLLRHVPELRGELLFDPCSGNGHMAAQLSSRFRRTLTNDLDPATPAQIHRNALNQKLYQTVRPSWTVSNPPFKWAGRIVHLALDYSAGGVAMFLRLTFLEACEWREWLAVYPPSKLIICPRIRFRGKGTDTTTCAWHIWSSRLSGPAVITEARAGELWRRPERTRCLKPR